MGSLGPVSWEYGSTEERPWFRIGSFGVGTTEFVALASIISMFLYAADPVLVEWLALIPSHLYRGAVWEIVTWPIANVPAFMTVWNIAIFWFMGRRMERELGRARFGWMLLAITVAGSVLAILLSLAFQAPLAIGGISTLAMIVVLLFIADNPHAPFFFGIPAWVIGLVMVAIPILQFLGDRAWLYLLHFVLTLVAAAVAAKQAGLLSQYAFIPGRMWTPGQRARKKNRQRGTSGATVVQGPWTSSYEPPAREDAEMDALLDKIMASGLDSLTAKERKRLEELRQQRRSR